MTLWKLSLDISLLETACLLQIRVPSTCVSGIGEAAVLALSWGEAGGEQLGMLLGMHWSRHGLLWRHTPFLQHGTVAFPLHADPFPQVQRALSGWQEVVEQESPQCCVALTCGTVRPGSSAGSSWTQLNKTLKFENNWENVKHPMFSCLLLSF